MNTQELIEGLLVGELSETKFTAQPIGSLEDMDYRALNGAINKALNVVFAKYNLLEKEFILVPIDGVTEYKLDETASLTNYPDTGYIQDNEASPFTGRVTTILRCFIEDGTEIAINDLNDPYSIFITGHDIVSIPNPIAETNYFFTYRKAPPVSHYPTRKEGLHTDLTDVLTTAGLTVGGEVYTGAITDLESIEFIGIVFESAPGSDVYGPGEPIIDVTPA